MKDALKSFCKGLIDYAGLFPPASLDMEDSFKNFLEYSKSDDSEMLGKFICPASRLSELTAEIEKYKYKKDSKFQIAVLGSGGKNYELFFDNFYRDIRNILEFNKKNPVHFITNTYEVKLPAEFSNPIYRSRLKELIGYVNFIFEDELRYEMNVFYEGFPNADSGFLELFSDALKEYNTSKTDNGKVKAGIKMRTGGIEAAAFPASDEIAEILKAANDKQIPFKATAGLHHPIKKYNESVSSDMHGFINVFGAGLLLFSNDLNKEDLVNILNEKHPENFIFTETHFKWKNYEVSNSTILRGRENFMISYGSCSFDEPREDLRNLGLM
ncbi:hypothetical protein BH10BAC5_BH10BAC5_09990 [soil metagenome]